MGQATITGGGSGGLYSIAIDTGSARIAARLAQIDAALAAIAADLVVALAAYEAEQDLAEPLQTALSVAIDAYTAALQASAPDEVLKPLETAMNTATEQYAKASAAVKASKAAYDALLREQTILTRTRTDLASVSTAFAQNAWCADLTEDGSGVVATLEIPGEHSLGGYILVAPGCPEPSDATGALLTRPAMTGPQAYFNAAVLPGWQRWMPTYRAGIAGAIDYGANTMDVALYDIRSSAQQLSINAASSLSAVPVSYMDCHASAFLTGDDVVVMFPGQTWDDPQVIGFLHDPRGCGCAVGVEMYADFDENVGEVIEGQITPIDQSPNWSWYPYYEFGSSVPMAKNESGLLKYGGMEMSAAPYHVGTYEDYAPTVNGWLEYCAKSGGVYWTRFECRVNFQPLYVYSGGSQVDDGAAMSIRVRSVVLFNGALLYAPEHTLTFSESVQSTWQYSVYEGSPTFKSVNIDCLTRGTHTIRIDVVPFEMKLYVDGGLVATVSDYAGKQCGIMIFIQVPTTTVVGSDGNLSTIDYCYLEQI